MIMINDNSYIVIKNGLVADGTGAPLKRCDLEINGDKIVNIGIIEPREGAIVVDATDQIVAPGFIDIHSHSDFLWLLHPECNSKVYDGVTTEICGNCGSSPFPIKGALLEHRKRGFGDLGLEIEWETSSEFFQLARSTPSSMNRGFLVGHGNLRACCIGYENRAASREEIEYMKRELSNAMNEGAFGLTSGIAYPPGCFATANEIIELSHVVKEFNAVYATHIRNEGDTLLDSLKEAINIARKTDVKLQISHLKTAGEKNWIKLNQVKDLLNNARSDGIKLHCDRYPYTASSTDLDSIFPKWVYEGGIEDEIKRLKDYSIRKKIKKELSYGNSSDQEFWQRIVISSVLHESNKNIEGQSVYDIAINRKKDPFETACDLLVEEDARIDALFFNMSEENLEEILKWEFVMVGSDSSVKSTEGVLNIGKPHPRSYGTFSRLIGIYCRKKKVLTIEDAIYKMTGAPAANIGLEKRGFLKSGYYADIVIFDLEKIVDRSEFTNPHKYSDGINYVIVNGKLTLVKGQHMGTMAGKILQRK